MLFSKRYPFGALDDSHIVWRGTQAIPTLELIKELTISLPLCASHLKPKGSGIVTRDVRHTVSWAYNYACTEKTILDETFVSEAKTYEVLLLKDISLCEIDLLFRLETVGRAGYTQYRISWRRFGDDEFHCAE